jgi:hypothetical protein
MALAHKPTALDYDLPVRMTAPAQQQKAIENR